MPNTGVSKPRVSDTVHPNNYLIRTEQEQGTLYSPEQTSLHESEGLLYSTLNTRFFFPDFQFESDPQKCKLKVFSLFDSCRIVGKLKKFNTNEFLF